MVISYFFLFCCFFAELIFVDFHIIGIIIVIILIIGIRVNRISAAGFLYIAIDVTADFGAEKCFQEEDRLMVEEGGWVRWI